MDSKSLTGTVVGLAVVVILAATLLMPALDNATQTHETFTNEGLYYLENPTESVTVEYLGSNEWEINGEPLDYTIAGATNILVFDNTFVRNNGQVRGGHTQDWGNAEIVINNGTITGTANNGNTPINWTYTGDLYLAANAESEYIMKVWNVDTYILDDSEIIGAGMTNVKNASGTNTSEAFYISVTDLTATVTAANENITISNVVLNTVAVDGYADLYKFTSVTFDATWGDYTTACNYSVVIVPAEVSAELSQHLSDGENAILSIIPIVIIASIVIAAVGMVATRRD